MKWIKNGGLLD